MKKIIAFIIMLAFCFNIVSVGAYEMLDYNDKSKAVKELILSKKELNTSIKGRKYISIIDRFIEVNKNNENKLSEIYNKIHPLLKEGRIKNPETLNIIKYMNSRVVITLVDLYENGPTEELSKIVSSKISTTDKKFIEDKIVRLQLNALEKGTSIIKNISEDFEDLTNYEETGDFEMDVNFDHDSFGKFDGNLKINDYSSSASGFDAQLKGEVEAFINAIPNGEEEIKLQLNSMVDFISKDGNMYLLLEKFNILEQEGVEDMKEFLEKATEIAAQNKYIEYSDPETQMGMNMLKSLNPTNIINDSKAVLSKPMITAYKKEGEKYYLIPTKYACDEFKRLANKFDPFSPSKCTDSQYKDLVKELVQAGTFYAEILDNNKTKIGFIGNKELGLEKNEGYIIFDDSKIIELKYEITEQNEGKLVLDYVNNSKLNLTFYTEETQISFISELSNKNKFDNINASVNIDDYNDKVIANLTLINHVITGDFEISNKYSEETFEGTITGKTNYSNELSELGITYKLSGSTDDTLNGSLSFGNSKVYFENYYEGKREKSTIIIGATLDEDYLPINGEIKINVFTKSGHYDYETYEYIYDENFSEVFKMDIDVNNKNISGTTNVSNGGETIIEINHTGNYSKEAFKLDSKFNLDDTYSMYVDPTGSIVSGNFNIDIDTNYNKNDANIFINLFFGTDEIFSFEMINTGKREFKDINIPTPTNTVDYKEVFEIEENNYNNYYY